MANLECNLQLLHYATDAIEFKKQFNKFLQERQRNILILRRITYNENMGGFPSAVRLNWWRIE